MRVSLVMPAYRQSIQLCRQNSDNENENDDNDNNDNNNTNENWSESQSYMSTKIQGDRILEEDLVPTLPPPYILSANLARVLHPS
jgi:hypothetical protein